MVWGPGPLCRSLFPFPFRAFPSSSGLVVRLCLACRLLRFNDRIHSLFFFFADARSSLDHELLSVALVRNS